jgi:hypothetical protein
MSGTTTSCQVTDQVPFGADGSSPKVGAGVSIYATYLFASTQGADPVKSGIIKGGLSFGQMITLPIADTQGRDCYADPTDLSKLPGWGPGTYTFGAYNSNEEISQGILVVLP